MKPLTAFRPRDLIANDGSEFRADDSEAWGWPRVLAYASEHYQMSINIKANRSSTKYTKRELLARILWGIFSIIFRISPRPFHRFRCFLLRCFGAQIGDHVHIYPSVAICFPWNLEIGDYTAIGDYCRIYNLGKIQIGSNVTISQFAHLCGGSHDFQSPTFDLLKLPVTIESDAWVCADAFVGSGVVVGCGAIVGARAVVCKNVQSWDIVAGNPAKTIGVRTLRT